MTPNVMVLFLADWSFTLSQINGRGIDNTLNTPMNIFVNVIIMSRKIPDADFGLTK